MISKDLLNTLKQESPFAYYLIVSTQNLLKKCNVRDLGKVMAEGNEIYQIDWINENTTLKVKKRDDELLEPNGGGHDIVSLDEILRIQGKLRATQIHLEQTRRKSGVNIENSENGHVRYKVSECDVFLFTRPDLQEYDNIDKWDLIAIPSKVIEDPKKPGYILGQVPKKIWKKYVGNAKEVLESEYEKKLTNHKY